MIGPIPEIMPSRRAASQIALAYLMRRPSMFELVSRPT
jgi:hypothetical protein